MATRGGAALSRALHKPIKFVGTGEKLEDLSFHPEQMASKFLEGRYASLIERQKQLLMKKGKRA